MHSTRRCTRAARLAPRALALTICFATPGCGTVSPLPRADAGGADSTDSPVPDTSGPASDALGGADSSGAAPGDARLPDGSQPPPTTCGASGTPACPAGLVPYARFPGSKPSTRFSVKAAGRDIDVESFLDAHLARFAASGPVAFELTHAAAITSVDISPRRLGLRPQPSGTTLAFELNAPAKLIVRVNETDKLIVLADPPETDAPQRSGEGIIDMSTRGGVDPTCKGVSTTAIQGAIDELAKRPSGGLLYFPDGCYKTGSLFLKSNVWLYLEPSALIASSLNLADLVELDATSFCHNSLLYAPNAQNLKIFGRGAIQFGGRTVREANQARGGKSGNIVRLLQSRDVLLQDVILRDTTNWGVRLTHSDHVVATNVKVINDLTLPNTDCFDPENARDVTIQNSLLYCGDDGVSVKTTNARGTRDSYGIRVANNLIWTDDGALKIGTETTAQRMYDIAFEQNDIVYARRAAIMLLIEDGATCEDIRWVDNRIERLGLRLLELRIGKRAADSRVGRGQKLLIKNTSVERDGSNRSIINGYDAAHPIADLTVENLMIAGQRVRVATDGNIELNAFVPRLVFR